MMTGLIATFLTQRGHLVATAKNGIEGLEKLKLTNYDLVMSDVQMPICDGYEMVIKLRAWELSSGALQPQRVVLLSGNARPSDLAKAREAGADGYLQKPVTFEDLLSTLADDWVSNLTTATVDAVPPHRESQVDGFDWTTDATELDAPQVDGRLNVSTKQVLIVDDSRVVAEMISIYLTSKGHAVDLAADGVEGMEKLQLNSYDLVLCDVRMPKCDGYELLSQLRAWEASQSRQPQRVFLMSCNPLPSDQWAPAGANGYLRKPLSFEDLLLALADQPTHNPGLESNSEQVQNQSMSPRALQQPHRIEQTWRERYGENFFSLILPVIRGADSDLKQLEMAPSKMRAHKLKGVLAQLVLVGPSSAAGRLEELFEQGVDDMDVIGKQVKHIRFVFNSFKSRYVSNNTSAAPPG